MAGCQKSRRAHQAGLITYCNTMNVHYTSLAHTYTQTNAQQNKEPKIIVIVIMN